MNATQKAFINLISNQLFMSDYKIEPDVDIKGLCEMACKHSLAALLYAELVKQPKSDKVSEASLKLYAHFFSTVSKSANQDAECGKVSKAFSEHKIRHLIVKGMAIKNDYPIA
ncbi:MAG: nucleotidyltransferase family protein, partial [Oscillospiraceae bacterium]